jgi:cytochrome bd-type quinol oxidase subunit 2
MERLLQSRNTSKILLAASVFVCLFYVITSTINNAYDDALAGALFELLSLPILIMLMILPVLCIIHLVSKGSAGKMLSALSLVFIAVAVVLIAV